MTAAAVIERAAELLEQGWCKGHYAVASDGDCALPLDDDAIGWCADGALYRAAYETGEVRLHIEAKQKIIDQIGVWGIPSWNDNPHRTKSQVLEVFRRAACESALTGETGRVAVGAA